ncbi:MAG: pilus assembly protein PilM [Firmicutes bacterium]|nr:pilus assembly protein PilM [Bacillota bacterium]
MKNTVAIIDFGSQKLVGLVGRRGVNGQLDILARIQKDYGGYRKGRFRDSITDIKVLVSEIVSELESSALTKINKVYVGVPSDFITVQVGQAKQGYAKRKAISRRKIANIADLAYSGIKEDKFELINKSGIDYLIDEKTRTFKPEKTKASKFAANVSFVFCENYFIENIYQILEDLDIRSSELVCATLAQSLYAFTAEEREKDVVILDVGYSAASLSIICGEGLRNLVSLDFGGQDVTEIFADAFKLTIEEAEQVKKEVILNCTPLPSDSYESVGQEKMIRINAQIANKLIKEWLECFAKSVSRALKNMRLEEKNIREIYLTGGGLSYLRGGADYLSKLIAYPLEVRNAPQLETPTPTLVSELGVLNLALIINGQVD